MANNWLTNIDIEIAKHYVHDIMGSLIFGENRVCLWWPGCGKSTIINDLLKEKGILKKELGPNYQRFAFYYVVGYDMETISSIPYNQLINQGKEVVVVIDEIDHLPLRVYTNFLQKIFSITKQNHRRIHTIINICDINKFNHVLKLKPFLYTFINKQVDLSPISGDILERYITSKALEFKINITSKDIKKISTYTGGFLFLTKELLRSFPDEGNLNAKIVAIWSRIQDDRKENLEKLGLSVFNKKAFILSVNTSRLLKKGLSHQEFNIYKLLTKNKKVSREQIAKLVWDKDIDERYTDWALDQIMSRFRKKLAKCHIDPENLKTIKRKGYAWKP